MSDAPTITTLWNVIFELRREIEAMTDKEAWMTKCKELSNESLKKSEVIALLMEGLEEIAKPSYKDSNIESLFETNACRAKQTLTKAKAMMEGK